MENNDEKYLANIKGKIIYLHPKGWGFINSHAIEFSKVYFHWTGLSGTTHFKTLKKNDNVTFNALKRDKGWKAVNIEVVNGPEKVG